MKLATESTATFIKSHKDLKVYQVAYAATLELHKLTSEFPKTEIFAMTDQIRRASRSICANIAEGFAKQQGSSAEFNRFLQMASGSAAEISVWLDLATDFGYIKKEQSDALLNTYNHISRMLNGLRNRK